MAGRGLAHSLGRVKHPRPFHAAPSLFPRAASRCGALALAAAAAFAAENGPFPALIGPRGSDSVLGVLLAEYYDLTRADPERMVERAIRGLDHADIRINGEWKRPADGAWAIHLSVSGKPLAQLPAPKPGSLQSAFALIESIRLAVTASALPQDRAEEACYALVNGALLSLDPHTYLLPPVRARDFRTDIAGEFSGIGAVMKEEAGRIHIGNVMPGRPAEKAGVQDDDLILAVDGESVAGMLMDQVVSRIRGPQGTTVRLTLERKRQASPLEISIVRQNIQVVNVRGWRRGTIGYLQANDFNALLLDDIRREWAKLSAEAEAAGTGIEVLVLDLRRNPGGLLDQAKWVTDLFLTRGKEIVRTVERTPDGRDIPRPVRSSGRQVITCPVAVLTSNNTASASEILAGALQIHNRAITVGSQSFGKGTVQTTRMLSDPENGSQLKLLIQEYRLKDGVSIQDVGLTPDLALRRHTVDADGKVDLIPYTQEREEDRDAALSNRNPYTHAGSLALSWLSGPVPPEELRRTNINARDFTPDREAMLLIDLLAEAAATPGFAARAEAARTEERQRDFLIDALRPCVEHRSRIESATLAAALLRAPQPIIWGEAGAARPILSLSGPGFTEADAGVHTRLRFVATNSGTTAAGQIYALVDADQGSIMWESEAPVGLIAPGATAAFTLNFPTPSRSAGGSERFTVTLRRLGEESATLASTPVEVAIRSRPRPRLTYTLTVAEPGGDNALDPGDAATLTMTIRNEGPGASFPLSMSILKDDNPFVSLGGEVLTKLPELAAGAETQRTLTLGLAKVARDRAHDGSPVKLAIRIEEVLPDTEDMRNRVVVAHQAVIPVGKPLQPIAIRPPAIRIDGMDADAASARLRVRVLDDNLRYVSLFQNEDKIDLRPATELAAEDGAHLYAPSLDLKPGLNTIRLVAADGDEAVDGLLLRLWGGPRP